MRKSKLKTQNIFSILSCFCALCPCFFGNIVSSGGIIERLVFYIAAFVFGLLSLNWNIKIKKWMQKTLIAWGMVFALCLFNRNGDLQNGNYTYILNLFFIIVYSILFASQNRFFLYNFLKVTFCFLMIHLIFGFYFLFNPSSLISFAKKYFSLGDTSYSKFLRFVNAGAFMGITSHYSTSGMYMAVAVILMASYLFAYRILHKKWNVMSIALFSAFFVALILTQKRAQLLFSAFTVVLIYFVGYVNGNLNRRILQICTGVLLLVVAFFVLLNVPAFEATITRYVAGGDLDETSSGRISQLWTPAWNDFLEHPMIGIGWRQFKYLHPMSSGVNNDTHNIYLQLLAENGIFSFVYIMILMARSYFKTWKSLLVCKKSGASEDYVLLLFSFGYQTFFLLYGLTGNPFYEVPCLFPYFLSCCICYKYCADHKHKRKASNVMIQVNARRAS